jgi:adenylate cyclase
MQGMTRWLAEGDIPGALSHFEQSAARYDPDRDSDSAFRFGQDSGVVAKAYLAMALWISGEPDRARAVIEDMKALAFKIGHFPTVAYAHYHHALFEMIRLDPASAEAAAAASVATAKEHGIALWQAIGPVLHGWAAGSVNNLEAGLNEMREAIASCREQKIRAVSSWLLPLFALLQEQSGQFNEALATLALAITELDGNHFWDAEVHRMHGQVLLKGEPENTGAAEKAFLRAIAVAQRQKAKSFELRAALSLANHYQSAGRPFDAHSVLRPALKGFTATPEFPEIAEAQRLLAALAR